MERAAIESTQAPSDRMVAPIDGTGTILASTQTLGTKVVLHLEMPRGETRPDKRPASTEASHGPGYHEPEGIGAGGLPKDQKDISRSTYLTLLQTPCLSQGLQSARSKRNEVVGGGVGGSGDDESTRANGGRGSLHQRRSGRTR